MWKADIVSSMWRGLMVDWSLLNPMGEITFSGKFFIFPCGCHEYVYDVCIRVCVCVSCVTVVNELIEMSLISACFMWLLLWPMHPEVSTQNCGRWVWQIALQQTDGLITVSFTLTVLLWRLSARTQETTCGTSCFFLCFFFFGWNHFSHSLQWMCELELFSAN